MCRIRCLGTSRTRPHAANQGERHRLALTAISLRAARLRAARTQQTLTLARCLRVGVDEFRALDKVAAVQLEGAPTFRLLHQPLEQGVQPRVGGLATGGRPGPPPPRVPGVRRDPVALVEVPEVHVGLGIDPGDARRPGHLGLVAHLFFISAEADRTRTSGRKGSTRQPILGQKTMDARPLDVPPSPARASLRGNEQPRRPRIRQRASTPEWRRGARKR
jgi:hypothetical protein